ncbi:MAG: hypothetical protein V1650_03115 [Candidatus Omnitrophota bacterium]
MKNFIIMLVIGLALLSQGSAFAGQCCAKGQCKVGSVACCKDGVCNCADKSCCANGACKCTKDCCKAK